MTPDERAHFVAADALLREAFDYLCRLPAVPTTVDLARRIRSHIEDPGRAVATNRAVADEQFDHSRSGGTYTPAGLAVVELEVTGSKAVVWTADLRGATHAEEHNQVVLRRLRRGEEVQLKIERLGRSLRLGWPAQRAPHEHGR